MKSNKTKVLIVLLIILLLVWIIRSTYSKYSNEAIATIERNVGQWVIKVNNTDITEKYRLANSDNTVDLSEPVEFTINGSDMIWYENSTKTTRANKFQPNGCGEFSFVIDPSGTDTSIAYEITIDQSSIRALNNGMQVTSVSSSANTLVVSGLNTNTITATGKMLLANVQNGTTDTITINLVWSDNGTQDDSEYAGETISLPISLNVIQYTGT